MHDTIIRLPHVLFEGWLAGAWLVLGIGMMVWTIAKNGWNSETWNALIVVVVGAVVILFVFPMIEQKVAVPDSKIELEEGLAIRGYGLMFLLGVIAAVSITAFRARQMGMNPEFILSLAGWMFLFGIIGARMFYVIQYSDQFVTDGKFEIASIIDMTRGGLVVYGSVIGGLIAGVAYLYRSRLPILATFDLIAPGMVIGLALGRLGCLLNGCCYGGACDLPVAIQFPQGSPPYMRDLESGYLLGVELAEPESEAKSEGWLSVVDVKDDSWADQNGIAAGDQLQLGSVRTEWAKRARSDERFDVTYVVHVKGKGNFPFRITDLPKRSQPIHPTQIYSSVNAFLLCALLWFAYPFRKNDGEVFATMITLYAITRFLLELIRADEFGKFNTEITISQWVSFGMFAMGLLIFAAVRLRRIGLKLPAMRTSMDPA